MTITHFEIGSVETSESPQSGGDSRLGFQVRHLSHGRSQGVQIIRLTCGEKTVDVIPTRGMGIWQAHHGAIRFGFNSPVKGPIHPTWVSLTEPSGLGWLDGFDEMSVRCGLSSNGAPEFDPQGRLVYPLHGRIANLPAENVVIEIDQERQAIAIAGVVEESRFHFHRWQLHSRIELQIDEPEIRILDQVINCSDRTGTCQMLYHNNFGPPILGPGSKLMAPVKKLVPRNEHAAKGLDHWNQFAASDPAYSEEVFFMELASDESGVASAMLANADNSIGVSIGIQTSTLPYFTLWKNTVGNADGYVAGLEPATNFPNPKSFEAKHDRVVTLEGGEQRQFEFSIGLLTTPETVAHAAESIASLSPESPTIHAQPTADWCSD